MTIEFDPSGDLAQAADQQTEVTLRRPGGQEAVAVGAVRTTFREVVLSSHEAGDAVRCEAMWRLTPPQAFGPLTVGDEITEAENCWRIIEVTTLRLGGAVQCKGVAVRLADRFSSRVDIEQAVEDESNPQLGIVAWKVIRAAAPASIRPVATESNHDVAPATSTAFFRITLEEELPLDHRHRLRAADGGLYRVEVYRAGGAGGDLPEVEATLVGPE